MMIKLIETAKKHHGREYQNFYLAGDAASETILGVLLTLPKFSVAISS